MANEIFSRDQNHVTVLGAITNDSNQDVKMLRVDPATGRLIVSAVIAGTNNGQLKVSAADTTYGYLSDKLVAGTNVTLTVINPGANETYQIDVQGGGYDEVQENGVALPARNVLNFKNGFTVSDNVGNVSTDVEINEAELDLALMGGLLDLSTQVSGQLNATYIDQSSLDLSMIGGLLDWTQIDQNSVSVDLATQVTGILPAANIDISDLEGDLDLANIGGQIDLTTQVTGLLPPANIDVTALAGDATFLAALIPNLDENVKVAVDGVTITGDGTTANPLVATGSGLAGNTISATAAMTLTGATTPKPVTFGNGSTVEFFDRITGIPPTFTENVGTVAQEKLTYTFTVDANQVVNISQIKLWTNSTVGTPADNLRVSIQTTSGGNPTGTILSSGTVTVGGIAGISVTNISQIELTAGTYAVVVDRTGAADNSNYWIVGCNNDGGINTAPFYYDGANWIADNLQPAIRLANEFISDSVYISAQATGFRMQSVIVNSGSGNTSKETIPAILQDSHGFVTSNVTKGNTTPVIISGVVSGFTGLSPTSLYEVTSSNGTIGVGTGTDVGRALTTTSIVIIPS